VIGLAEMMNFPGVDRRRRARAREARLDGARTSTATRRRARQALNAYAAAGIRSDHEAYTARRAQRLRAGMWLLIREASARATSQALLPLVREFGPRGSRSAPTTASRSTSPTRATSTRWCARPSRGDRARGRARDGVAQPARLARLAHLGAVAPGYQADLLVLPDLERSSRSRAEARRAGRRDPAPEVPEWVQAHRAHRADVADDFAMPSDGGRARVIGVVPDQIVTEALVEEPTTRDGQAVADADRDLAKIAVVERHLGTGRIGVGLVRGFGLRAARSRPRSRTTRTTSSSSA
jgi:adenine deaminase